MKVIIQLPAVTRRLILTMNQMFVILFLGLLLPTTVRGQGPLSPSYMPSMDTNPADYPSNIWITDTMTKVRQDAGSPERNTGVSSTVRRMSSRTFRCMYKHQLVAILL